MPVLNAGENTFNYLWYMFLSNIGQAISTSSGISLAEVEALLMSLPSVDPSVDGINARIEQLNTAIASIDAFSMQNMQQQLDDVITQAASVAISDPYIQQLEARVAQLEALQLPDYSAQISQLESKLAELDSYTHTLPIQA